MKTRREVGRFAFGAIAASAGAAPADADTCSLADLAAAIHHLAEAQILAAMGGIRYRAMPDSRVYSWETGPTLGWIKTRILDHQRTYGTNPDEWTVDDMLTGRTVPYEEWRR